MPALATILAAPAANATGGFHVKPKGEGVSSSFTLVFDLYLSSANSGKYHGLFQNDLSNASDGDLFINRGAANGDSFGIGIGGNYPGGAAMDAWHRIAFSIKDIGGGAVEINRFIDGVKVGETLTKSADRYAFDHQDGFYILTDNDGETLPSGLAAFAYVPNAMGDAEIAALGKVAREGVLKDGAGLEFNFQNGDMTASKGEGTLAPRDAAQAGQIGEAESVGYPQPPLPTASERIVLFAEDFESLADKLGPYVSPSESGGDGTDWTAQTPNGWTMTTTAPDGGPVEFKGWTFHDKASWIKTAGDQNRSFFDKGQGVVAVADPDEYDDIGDIDPDQFSAQLNSPEFDISAGAGRSLFLTFDSSWRPEDFQRAKLLVSYDGGTPVEILDWGSNAADANYKPDAENERIAVTLTPPTGAKTAKLIFDMPIAGNDWWWAVDNIEVSAGGQPPIDDAKALAFTDGGVRQGFQIDPKVDGDLTSYSLVWDVKLPANQPQDYGSLLQLGADNSDDGEFFLRKAGPGKFALGVNGDYTGEVKAGEWTRIAATLTDLGDGQSRLDKFINGVKVGSQLVDTARFTLKQSDGLKIMADESGEIFNGKIAGFSLLDRAMTDAEIAALRGAGPGGAFSQPPAGDKLFQFDFTGGSQIKDGGAKATIGDATIGDRTYNPITVERDIQHRLLKVGEHVEIELDGMFKGAEVTYSLKSSDGAPIDAKIEDGKLIFDAKALGFSDFTLTATDALGNEASDSFRMRVAGDNAYAFAVLPDTQNYTESNQHIFGDMTNWLAANKDSMKLQIVTHVGDVTGSNFLHQWKIVDEAYKALEKAGLKYTLLPGNHDQALGGSAADHSSNQDQFFGMGRYFADSAGEEHGVYDGEAGSTKNNFKTFTAPDGTDWIVLSLEFGPRDDVLRWADEVLSEHADRRAIVLTHHYTNMADVAGPNSGPLYREGTGKNYGMKTSDEGVNDGRDIWDKVLTKHGNVSFVFSGHVFGDGAETQVRYGDQGNPVHQIFVNYQNGVAQIMQGAGDPGEAGRGGNGAMRIVIVDPDNKQMHTETYYTELDKFMTGSRGDADPSRDGKGTLDSGNRQIQPVEFGNTDALGFPAAPDGSTPDAIKLPKFDPNNGLRVETGFDPKGGGDLYESYTLVYDMFIPGDIGLTSILQTDLNNVSDGDLWIQRKNGAGAIGANAQDDGPFQLNDWSRVAVVFQRLDGEAIRYRCDKYVDGVLIGSQIFEGDRRTIKKDGFLLFADDGLETPKDWALSAFAFVEKALTAAEVAKLGEVDADGPFSGPLDGVNGVQFSFKNGKFTPDFGTGEMSQRVGADGGVSLSGRYVGHQETFDNVDLGAVDAQFRAVAGEDAKVDLTKTDKVTLDGSSAVDKLGQVISAKWFNQDGEMVAEGATAKIDAEAGAQRYTLRLEDAQGRVSTDETTVVGVDTDTLLFESFNDGDLNGWQVKYGQWGAIGAAKSGAGTAEASLRNLPDARGLILWDGAGASDWTDYTVSARIENEGEAPMGLVAYASGLSRYQFEFAVAEHAIRLVKVEGLIRTVLAETRDGAPFDRAFTAELAVENGRLTAAIDGKTLFGGAVTDANPLTKGSVGVFHEGASPMARIDDVSVRKGALIADAGADRRVFDIDGDGKVEVLLSTDESGARGGAVWSENGAQIGAGDEARVTLGVGEHLIRLDQSVGGARDHDTAQVEVVAKRDILLMEDFSSDADRWTFVDEGELGDAAKWAVVDGELVQSENRYSRQLMGSGDTAPDSWWSLDWSPLGDGYHVLRKGTYALLNDPKSAHWTDYSVEFDFKASGGAVGLLFHYKDEKNHYKLELDRKGGMSQLVSVVDGYEQIEWQAKPNYDPSGDNHLRLDIVNGKISAWLDGHLIFTPVEIHKIETGGIGLYNWGAPGTAYDNVAVVSQVTRAEITETDQTEILTGGDAAELFTLTGGNDWVTTGGGADVIHFTAHDNGVREIVKVSDFDTARDMLDLDGAQVIRHVVRGGDLLIMLDGDRDLIRLEDVSTLDDVTII